MKSFPHSYEWWERFASPEPRAVGGVAQIETETDDMLSDERRAEVDEV